MFITTANVLDTIPGPLRDRMEIIELSSYTEDEKLQIARGYLIPRQIRENGLRQEEIDFRDDALREAIQGYTREAGVRSLERQIGKICRKIAAKVAAGNSDGLIVVDKANVSQFLGKREIHPDEVVERAEMPGVAVGLAWTATGGDIMFFEATKSPGDKGFTLTGQLGDVMKESAQAALSYVRSRASALNIDPDTFRKSDIHLHIPAGAIPKDGPSAGITMSTALVSLLTGKPLRPKKRCWQRCALDWKRLFCPGTMKPIWKMCRQACGRSSSLFWWTRLMKCGQQPSTVTSMRTLERASRWRHEEYFGGNKFCE
jgi:ATP-dependent Lon protease